MKKNTSYIVPQCDVAALGSDKSMLSVSLDGSTTGEIGSDDNLDPNPFGF